MATMRKAKKTEEGIVLETIEPAPVPEPEPGPEPTPEVPAEPEMTPTVTVPEPPGEDGRTVLRRVMDVPKGKRAMPTLLSYPDKWGGGRRYVIIDVQEPILRTAWAEWRRATGSDDPETFIGDVCNVLETDYPRLYRGVVPLDL